MDKHYFNSIKVRLKHLSESLKFTAKAFQFHKGAIKTALGAYRVTADTDFNSIKVRLKRLSLFQWCALCQFQFHKGAIKTERKRLYYTCNDISIP